MSPQSQFFSTERSPQRPAVGRFDVSAMAQRAGGHFKLCALVTKRARELMNGAPRLSAQAAKSYITVSLREFLEDRIAMVTAQEARRRLLGGDVAEETAPAPSKK